MKRMAAVIGTAFAIGLLSMPAAMDVLAADITEARAKEIAMEHAGVSEKKIPFIKAELDHAVSYTHLDVYKRQVHGTWAHDIICPADVQDRQGHRGYPGHRGSGICHGPHLWPGNQQITERIL